MPSEGAREGAAEMHKHKCVSCGGTWVCTRIMDEETLRRCAEVRGSICDGCLRNLDLADAGAVLTETDKRRCWPEARNRPRISWVYITRLRGNLLV